jgi:hypothetical protein
MDDRKSLFRRVFDTMIEGRSQQAQRYIDAYLQWHRPPETKAGRFTGR